MTSLIGADLLGDQELVAGAREPELDQLAELERVASARFQGSLEHPVDAGDIDDIQVQSPLAGLLHPLCPVTSDQAQKPVDLAHAGPGQRTVQELLGIGANAGTVASRHLLQVFEITEGIGALLVGEVLRVSGAPPWWLAGMDLDQPATVEDLDQMTVAANMDMLPDQMVRNRVKGPADLDVEVTVDFGLGVQRQLIEALGGRQQGRL